MNLDIGAKRLIDGDQVFLVGRCSSTAEPPFVLLYDAVKSRRAKRNLSKVQPRAVVEKLGIDYFAEVEAPYWGTVWFRVSKIREIRAISADDLTHSEAEFGALVLFVQDPEPLDEHSGFLLFGVTVEQASKLLGQAIRP